MCVSLKKKPAKLRESEERERERERSFRNASAHTHSKKNSSSLCPLSRGTHSKKENRECISPDQRHLYAALTYSNSNASRGREREREEELIRLYRKNFKPRGEETAFEIYRKREREREHVRARETRDG
jgi:hypothetical protein